MLQIEKTTPGSVLAKYLDDDGPSFQRALYEEISQSLTPPLKAVVSGGWAFFWIQKGSLEYPKMWYDVHTYKFDGPDDAYEVVARRGKSRYYIGIMATPHPTKGSVSQYRLFGTFREFIAFVEEYFQNR